MTKFGKIPENLAKLKGKENLKGGMNLKNGERQNEAAKEEVGKGQGEDNCVGAGVQRLLADQNVEDRQIAKNHKQIDDGQENGQSKRGGHGQGEEKANKCSYLQRRSRNGTLKMQRGR
jgi:hypothetical protein